MLKRMIIIGGAVFLASSCITEGNYGTKMSATFCKRYKECQPEQFEAEYDSVSDCKDKSKESLTDFSSAFGDCLKDAGCKFDSGAASSCRSSINSASCENLFEGFSSDCSEVYNCDDASDEDVAACFSASTQ